MKYSVLSNILLVSLIFFSCVENKKNEVIPNDFSIHNYKGKFSKLESKDFTLDLISESKENTFWDLYEFYSIDVTSKAFFLELIIFPSTKTYQAIQLESSILIFGSQNTDSDSTGYLYGIKRSYIDRKNIFKGFYIKWTNERIGYNIKEKKIEKKKYDPDDGLAPLRRFEVSGGPLPIDHRYFYGVGKFTKQIETSLDSTTIKMLFPKFAGKIKSNIYEKIKFNLDYKPNENEFYDTIEFLE